MGTEWRLDGRDGSGEPTGRVLELVVRALHGLDEKALCSRGIKLAKRLFRAPRSLIDAIDDEIDVFVRVRGHFVVTVPAGPDGSWAPFCTDFERSFGRRAKESRICVESVPARKT